MCLDLAGRLPPPDRVREFLASKDPQKRTKLIDALIGSPEFVDYWTFRFDDVFRVSIASNGINTKWSQMYADWVRDSIAQNKPYSQMARERLTAQGYDGVTRHFLPYDVIGPPGETMAEEVRVFFGRRLDCAQCHNHPYEAWTQDQFWGLAAFFGRLFKMGDTGFEYVVFDHPLDQAMGNGDVNGSLKMLHPRTKAAIRRWCVCAAAAAVAMLLCPISSVYVLQVDVGLGHGGQLDLRFLRRLLEALKRHAVLAQIDAVGLPELRRDPVDDPLIEIVAAEVGVAVGGLHLDDALAHFEHGDVERAAAEVVDGDDFVLFLVEAVGERRGGRLVDDAQHVQPAILPASFVACRWASLKYAGTVMTASAMFCPR